MPIPKLDHIVILLPVATTAEALLAEAKPFTKQFTLSPGGFHTDNKTQNVLISLADGVYLELVAFTSTPPNDHPWAQRKPTRVIDVAFVGYPGNCEAYQEDKPGGRGECRWVVTMPKRELSMGRIPFWCADVTPRDQRVPKPTTHPSGVTSVKKITILVDSEGQQERLTQLYREITGTEKMEVETSSGGNVEIDVHVAETEEEKNALAHDGCGIYKVEFDVPGVVLSNSIF
jgi:Glyoxalase-like domain